MFHPEPTAGLGGKGPGLWGPGVGLVPEELLFCSGRRHPRDSSRATWQGLRSTRFLARRRPRGRGCGASRGEAVPQQGVGGRVGVRGGVPEGQRR